MTGHDSQRAGSPETPVRTLSAGWRAGAWALVVGALALAAGGFVNSFAAVRDAVAPSFGPLAWTVPLLIDVGVGVFTGIDLLFTRLRMRLRWLRLVPWSLIAATVWLNVADESTSVGVVAHAAPPVLWVVTVELAAHAMRVQAGLDADRDGRRRGVERMDRVRLARWLLAPWSTLVIRRWMILQEERSYVRAYARWWDRKQAKWELQDSHGPVLWRFRAPRRARGFYRYGHLTPDVIHAGPAADGIPAGPGRPVETASNGKTAGPRGASARRRSANGGGLAGKRRAEFADVVAVVAELEAEGLPVNRTVVGNRLRHGRNLRLSHELADELLGQLGQVRPPDDDGPVV